MAARTLDELIRTYHSPDPAIRTALLATTDAQRTHRKGTQIASDRVLDDAINLFGAATAFYESATLAQRRLLAGVGPGTFRVCVTETATLADLWARQQGVVVGDRTQRTTGTLGYAAARAAAVADRRLATGALGTLAGLNQERALAVAQAAGSAESDELLAQALEALAALGLSWSTTPELRALCADALVDTTWAGQLRASAAALRDAAAQEGRRTTAGVTQPELDQQDGVVLHLLRRVIRVFDAANVKDPSIPRLFPYASYRVLGLARPGDRVEEEDDEAPAAPAPTSGA